jgi:adenylate kinase family enzyme
VRDEWIIDGNYSRTLDIRLRRADAAIMLDFSRALCLYRAVKRALLYRGAARPDMAPGCPEKLDPEFVRFIWDYPKRSRERVLGKLEGFGAQHLFLHVTRPRQVQVLLDSLESSAAEV